MKLFKRKKTVAEVRKAILEDRLVFASWDMKGKGCRFFFMPAPNNPENIAAIEYDLTNRESIKALKGLCFHVNLTKGGKQ